VGRQAARAPRPLDQEYAYQVEVFEPLRSRDRSELDQCLATGQKFDEIIDSPAAFARSMDELLVCIGAHGVFVRRSGARSRSLGRLSASAWVAAGAHGLRCKPSGACPNLCEVLVVEGRDGGLVTGPRREVRSRRS
jgi:hypothetical protein